MDIRTLRADEIEVRVGSENKNKTGMSLLLYKDARCDMRILDEAFGFDGWQREHQVIDGKLFCTLKVWSDKMNQWICKQDVGTESNAEAEKGQASDSFKRACFNLGIGRELYTSPFIWINYSKGYTKYSKFKVKEIGYNDRKEINLLVIEDEEGKEAFKYTEKGDYRSGEKKMESNLLLEQIYDLASKKGFDKDSTNKSISARKIDINNFNNEAYETMYKALVKLEDKFIS